MSDYSKTTNFTAKDALASGDPNKVIKGSEHDAEYDNIATSSATKANKITSPTTNSLIMQSAAGDLVDSTVTTNGSGTVTATAFVGPLAGNVTGSADTATTAGGLTGTTLGGDVTNSGNTITLVDTIAGNRVYIDSKTASASASLVFTTGIDSTYDRYEFELINVVPATSDTELLVQLSNDTGSTYHTTGYLLNTSGLILAATSVNAGISNVAAHGGISGTCQVINPAASGIYTIMSCSDCVYLNANAPTQVQRVTSGGIYATAETNDAVRFIMVAGNITSGTVNLYGIKK